MLRLPGIHAAESELEFYFGRGESLLGGHSNMGPMLEWMTLYHVPREARTPPELVTAWHHGARPHCEHHVPDDDGLRRFGLVARKLRAAAARWPDAPAILGNYYGELGDRFAQLEHQAKRMSTGRLGALLPFTSAGKKLIDRARKKERGAKLKVSDAQRAENAIAAPGVDTNVLLTQGMMEARALLARALEAYIGMEDPCLAAAE